MGRLLHEAGYSLQANSKTEGSQHPDRDAQFRHLHDTVAAPLAAGMPVISVDCKKKELVGQYKNGGRDYRPAGDPEKVDVHDFIGEAGQGDPLRRLRPGRQHRMGVGGHRPRHRRVRGEHDAALVEHPRPAPPTRRRPVADHRRQRWRQRQPASAPGRPSWPRSPPRPAWPSACATCRRAPASGVAVGTALTGGPPHGSRRAELPHRAPASGSGCEAHVRVGMHHTDLREPPSCVSAHPRPGDPTALAAPP